MGNIRFQELVPDVGKIVPYDLETEVDRIRVMHEELGTYDEGWASSKAKTGSLAELECAAYMKCAPHWTAALDPRGAERRERAVGRIVQLEGLLERAQEDARTAGSVALIGF